jgi:hypothetical protein
MQLLKFTIKEMIFGNIISVCSIASIYYSFDAILDNNSWTLLIEDGFFAYPFQRYDSLMAYLPSKSQLLIFGGTNKRRLNDCWIYDLSKSLIRCHLQLHNIRGEKVEPSYI